MYVIEEYIYNIKMCKKFPLFTCINVCLLKLIFSKDVLLYFFVFARRAVRKAWKGEEAVLPFIASNLASESCFFLVGFRVTGRLLPPLASARGGAQRTRDQVPGMKPTNFANTLIQSYIVLNISDISVNMIFID